MFKFFRSIRQGLMNEGQTSKYFRYALGEVALIVVGILIAVQIGEWNQRRTDAKSERQYIERLILNIEKDIAQFQFTIDLSNARLRLLNLLFVVAKDPNRAIESPVDYILAVSQAEGTASGPLHSDTYQELVSAGNLGLLDADVYTSIFAYYQRDDRVRPNQQKFDVAQDRYKVLRAGVLSVAQEEWYLENFSYDLMLGRSEAEAFHFDDATILESAIRLQANTELVNWLPQLNRNSHSNLSFLKAQLELAEALQILLEDALDDH